MTIGGWIFIVTLTICLIAISLVIDNAKSIDKGWEPVYKLLWDPMVEAWHLFWKPVTSLYKKLRGL